MPGPVIYAVGVDYAQPNDAIAVLPADYTGLGVQWLQLSSGSYNACVLYTPHTGMSASEYFRISPAPGVARDQVVLAGLTLFEDFAHADNLVAMSGLGTDKKQYITNCKIISAGENSADHGNFINCEFVRTNSSGYVITIYGTASFYGCLFKGGAQATIGYQGTPHGYYYNCVGISPINFVNAQGGNNNCSTDATAPGVNSILGADVADMAFLDEPNNDLHTTAASILQLAGGDFPTIYDTDADGVAIPAGQYPIGPYFTPSNKPNPPVLVSPADHATDVPTAVTFEWAEG